MDTVQEIQEQIALQKTHNESRLEDIRAKIERAENLGVGTHKLQYELDAAIKTIQAGERLAEARLKAAQEREAKEAQKQERRAQVAQSAIEAKQKRAASRTWEKNGGKAADFEAAWESIRLDLLKAETQKAIEQKAIEQSAPFFESL